MSSSCVHVTDDITGKPGSESVTEDHSCGINGTTIIIMVLDGIKMSETICEFADGDMATSMSDLAS